VSYPTLILIMLAATLVVAAIYGASGTVGADRDCSPAAICNSPWVPLCGALFSIQTYCSASALDRCDKRRSVTAFGHIIVQ
jgi:hypothetical protein